MRGGRIRLLLVLMGISLGLWIIFAKLVVPAVIESAYRGESWSFLNRMISGQATHPVSDYLQDWDGVTVPGLLGILGFWLIVLVTSGPAVIRRVRSKKREIRQWIYNSLILGGSIFVTMLLLEVLLHTILSHPNILVSKDGSDYRLLRVARYYYLNFDRHMVQLLPECARYDSELTYILKESSGCTISSREHRVEYIANREGLRDDDVALINPQIVVTGDSFAMGWGVAASESFAKIIQKDLNAPVLNASMSSYGTARELALLRRLKQSTFSILVIQYSDNDFDENKSFVENNGLKPMPEARFRQVARRFESQTIYYPFKYLFELVRLSLRTLPADGALPDTDDDEAKYFVEVLLRNEDLLKDKTIVVIELNDYNRNDDRFTSSVTRWLATSRYSGLRSRVNVLDTSRILTNADYYVLDDHMRAAGHRKVARLIEDQIQRLGVLRHLQSTDTPLKNVP